jgi:hypothetical protein
MDLVYNTLVSLHIIGAAMIVGIRIAQMKNPTVHPRQFDGAALQLITGIVMMGLIPALNMDANYFKLGIKFAIALAVGLLGFMGRRKYKKGEDLSAGLAGKIADVAGRTRDGKIGPHEQSGGTISNTNTGSVGALFDTPIINQPQVGILGTGAIVKRPVVVADENGDDSIAIRSMMYLSLTYDHRLVDGADAGRFLQSLKASLEEGAFEPDLGL